MFRKILTVLILCFTALIIGGCDNDITSLKKNDLTIATGGTGGTYYPLGLALKDSLNKNIRDCKTKVISTRGSMQNVRLLQSKFADIAFIQGDIAYYAANGLEMYVDKKATKLRCLASLYPEIVQIVVRKDSGIKTINDLRDKRVSVGPVDSGTELNSRQILQNYDISFEDLFVKYMDFSTAAQALAQGDIDAAFMTAGYPTPAIENLARNTDIALLPIEDEYLDELIAKHPFYSKVTLPTSSYNSQANISVAAIPCLLVATTRMEPDDAIKILTVLYNNPTAMRRSNTAANVIDKSTALVGMSITGHDGASKFFTNNK